MFQNYYKIFQRRFSKTYIKTSIILKKILIGFLNINLLKKFTKNLLKDLQKNIAIIFISKYFKAMYEWFVREIF